MSSKRYNAREIVRVINDNLDVADFITLDELCILIEQVGRASYENESVAPDRIGAMVVYDLSIDDENAFFDTSQRKDGR